MERILFPLVLLSFLVLPATVWAVTTIPTIPTPITSPQDIIRVIETIGNWLFAIFLAVAVIYILIAAYRFLTSGGDPTAVGAARNALLWAIVAIIVAVASRGVIAIVKAITG